MAHTTIKHIKRGRFVGSARRLDDDRLGVGRVAGELDVPGDEFLVGTEKL